MSLSILFYPTSFFHLFWPLIGIVSYDQKDFLRKWISSLMGLLTPFWIYFLGAFVFFDLDKAFKRFQNLVEVSYPILDVYFWVFSLISIFLGFILISRWSSFSRESFLTKSRLKVYFVSIFISLFGFIFFYDELKTYMFFMFPFCFYFSRYLENLKKTI